MPGAQSAIGAANGQKVPSAHVRQSSAPVMNGSNTFMRVPPGHGSGAAEPSAQ